VCTRLHTVSSIKAELPHYSERAVDAERSAAASLPASLTCSVLLLVRYAHSGRNGVHYGTGDTCRDPTDCVWMTSTIRAEGPGLTP
jgi:hypothetical protein